MIAYPQALIEHDLYINLLKGIETRTVNLKTNVLKLIRNLYNQKQLRQVWNKYLTEKLLAIGFRQ